MRINQLHYYNIKTVKYSAFFLLLFFCTFCINVHSQLTNISVDRINNRPYEFIVNKVKFRLIVLNGDGEFVHIQKFGSIWTEIDSTDVLGDNGCIFFDDVNKDGFNDLVFNEKWVNEIYLFNPYQSVYVNTGEFAQSDFGKLDTIDKNQNIYCESGQYKDIFGWSSLFQIKDYKRIDLGIIKGDERRNTKGQLIASKITISKIVNDDDEKVIVNIKWFKAFESYNALSYWKNNWKCFIH